MMVTESSATVSRAFETAEGRVSAKPMRFQAYKISGGRGVLKNAPSPGPPSHKTFRILVGCLDRRDSASLTGMFKKFLVERFGASSSFKSGLPEFLLL